MENLRQGLSVEVMGSDCTNGGVTSGKKSAFLRLPGVHAGGGYNGDPQLVVDIEFEPDPKALIAGQLVLVKGAFAAQWTGSDAPLQLARVIVRPVLAPEGKRPMFGGHFVYSSDSRFPFTAPLKVFDRFE